MFTYYMYKLIIQSEIELYNVPTGQGNVDVVIRHISNTDNRKDIFREDCGFMTSPNYTYSQCETGRFAIRKGKEIIFEVAEEANNMDVRALICGWGMAFLLTQRDNTVLHGTVLAKNNRALIISGASGSGKSTTALSLISKGYKYLADDMAVIGGWSNFHVTPSYPVQKVCRNIASQLDSDKLEYINEAKDKFLYTNYEAFMKEPVYFATLVHLKKGNVENIIIEKCKGLPKYLNTLECLFLGEIYVDSGTPEKDKFRCLKMAEQIEVIKITRPKDKDTLEEIVSLIMKEFEVNCGGV